MTYGTDIGSTHFRPVLVWDNPNRPAPVRLPYHRYPFCWACAAVWGSAIMFSMAAWWGTYEFVSKVAEVVIR